MVTRLSVSYVGLALVGLGWLEPIGWLVGVSEEVLMVRIVTLSLNTNDCEFYCIRHGILTVWV